MGIPGERLIRIQKYSLEDTYQIMKDHYVQFMEEWLVGMSSGEKAAYIASRNEKITEDDIISSFDFIRGLAEIPTVADIMEFAENVTSGCLSYTSIDPDIFIGIKIGVYAEYILEKINIH